MPQATRSRGFSLIEILVVLAIILVLAALLFPVFVRAKDSGYRTTCISNVRQLSAAGLQYASDNDGGLAYSVVFSGTWVNQMSAYMARTSLGCPKFQAGDFHPPPPEDGNPAALWLRGYSLNGCVKAEGQVIDTSKTVFFTEAAELKISDPTLGTYPHYPLILTGPDVYAYARENVVEVVGGTYGAERHGGATYSFFDGSAKWLKPSQLLLPNTDKEKLHGCNFRNEVTTWSGPNNGPRFAFKDR